MGERSITHPTFNSTHRLSPIKLCSDVPDGNLPTQSENLGQTQSQAKD
jgi:hypothetical protein